MKNFAYSAAALALLASGGAFAQCAANSCDAQIVVNAEVTQACTLLTATNVDFGPDSAQVDQDETSTITANCGTNVSYVIEIDYGTDPAGTIRRVTDGSGGFMDYDIFQPGPGGAGATTTPWGLQVDSAEYNGLGDTTDQALTATFRLHRVTAPVGLYQDIVSVTMTF